MAQFNQGDRIANEAAGIARDTVKKGEAATEQSLHAAQEGFAMAAESTRDFNLKMIEIARANTEAFFDFAQKAATTREPGALMELFTTHTKKQMEMFSKQSQELTVLGQKLAGKNVLPISGGLR
jgi:hypothetical protein